MPENSAMEHIASTGFIVLRGSMRSRLDSGYLYSPAAYGPIRSSEWES